MRDRARYLKSPRSSSNSNRRPRPQNKAPRTGDCAGRLCLFLDPGPRTGLSNDPDLLDLDGRRSLGAGQIECVAGLLACRIDGALFVGLEVRLGAELVAVRPPLAG